MFGLLEVSYGDLALDSGGVLHYGRLSRDRLHSIALRRTFRSLHPSRNGHYEIASRVAA